MYVDGNNKVIKSTLLMLNYQKSPTFIYITVTIKTEKMYDVIFDFVAGL